MRADVARVLAACPRQALHAQRLEFDHPADGRRLRFEAPLPADVGVVVDALRALAAPDDPPGG
jgi:23S rRNA pseudouridine1911/1915/1917 synthase